MNIRNAQVRKILKLEWVRGWHFICVFTGWWIKRKSYFHTKTMNRKAKKKLKMRCRDVPF